MADLPEQTLRTVTGPQVKLVKVVNLAKAAEHHLLQRHGETEGTQGQLNQLLTIAQTATTKHQRLSILILRIAAIQPVASLAILETFFDAIADAQVSTPALERSLEEIRLDWDLP